MWWQRETKSAATLAHCDDTNKLCVLSDDVLRCRAAIVQYIGLFLGAQNVVTITYVAFYAPVARGRLENSCAQETRFAPLGLVAHVQCEIGVAISYGNYLLCHSDLGLPSDAFWSLGSLSCKQCYNFHGALREG